MDWSVVMKKYGWDKEMVGTEPFSPLAAQAAAAKAKGEPVARITVSTGSARDYGECKVAVTVSIECPQTEASMNLAGECAFWKAVELTNDAASFAGVPRLHDGGTEGNG